MNNRQAHRIATNPGAMARCLANGRVPRMVKPSSPLVALLEALDPRDLPRLVGVTVEASLGYTGSRRFGNAAELLEWVRPVSGVVDCETFPAESWRDKRFRGAVHLDDLIAACHQSPDNLKARYPRLCRAPVAQSLLCSEVGSFDVVDEEAGDSGSLPAALKPT